MEKKTDRRVRKPKLNFSAGLAEIDADRKVQRNYGKRISCELILPGLLFTFTTQIFTR